jgi:hypothetical protein
MEPACSSSRCASISNNTAKASSRKRDHFGGPFFFANSIGSTAQNIPRRGLRNCRSLHSVTPDFLLELVALSQFMRPSLRKGAYAALSRAAWQEIRVRFGRDDKGEGGAFSKEWLVDEEIKHPSASLGMKKGAAVFPLRVVAGQISVSDGSKPLGGGRSVCAYGLLDICDFGAIG